MGLLVAVYVVFILHRDVLLPYMKCSIFPYFYCVMSLELMPTNLNYKINVKNCICIHFSIPFCSRLTKQNVQHMR